MFSRLLEIELWEVVFNLALRERHPRKDIRHVRYDNRVRPRAAGLLRQAQKAWQEDLRSPLTWSRIEVHEVAENVPKLMQEYGFQSYDAVHAATLLTSEVTDFLTRDGGFAALPPTVATLHTTQARLVSTPRSPPPRRLLNFGTVQSSVLEDVIRLSGRAAGLSIDWRNVHIANRVVSPKREHSETLRLVCKRPLSRQSPLPT